MMMLDEKEERNARRIENPFARNQTEF